MLNTKKENLRSSKTKCKLNCFCHTLEGEGLPAIDCCEHCCELWQEHNKEKVILKINIDSDLFEKVKEIVETDHRVMPMERKLFKQKHTLPRLLTEKIERYIMQIASGEVKL